MLLYPSRTRVMLSILKTDNARPARTREVSRASERTRVRTSGPGAVDCPAPGASAYVHVIPLLRDILLRKQPGSDGALHVRSAR